MPLPWVRVDSNIAQHEKVQRLLKEEPSAKRWQAFVSFVCSIAWSGGSGTDGRIPPYALSSIYGTRATADLLVKHGLWEQNGSGWVIHNYAEYQQLEEVTRAKSEQASEAALTRWYGQGARRSARRQR